MTSLLFETKRLQFRLMTTSDVENLLRIFSDSKAMVHYPSTKSKEETLTWIQWTLDNYRAYQVGMWIVEDKQTGAFLGQCGLVPQKIEGRIVLELGYLFLRSVWNHGYATEAATAVRNYAFHVLHVDEIISLIAPANNPSIRVAEKIGMTCEKEIEKWNKKILLYKLNRHERKEK
ncbi:GNAT family N-acetyltransferase [Metabacillus iocasae]|uniref:RimJ/RimL family protein N-acetyltransferase n=1 Tax=Priestia iocasae TaxID=2291674 RepID=A0ABS2R1G4_9BACI|nr:GNAT family N-acetyltransferase [Metabacillus iocasae]MBM7705057.1 RimJ/RimL family protein N-acetyltransferase [Metabacillus iocasae]